MTALLLHDAHERMGAQFTAINGFEVVDYYGDASSEYAALTQTVAVIDLSCRSRVCVTGADRTRFLNGQVTNNVKELEVGEGCYAALVTAKGRMQSDGNIYCLPEELLVDFEPGLTDAVLGRLERFIIADDVQLTDVRALYGLISVQGPAAAEAIAGMGMGIDVSPGDLTFTRAPHEAGEIYCMNHARAGTPGFDLFLPAGVLGASWESAVHSAQNLGGRPIGWRSLEVRRIEAGIPRFGADMDESNLPPEAGLEQRAISYSKGCYIGQEVIARIRTYGQASKNLRGLYFVNRGPLPGKGDKLFHGATEVGYVTSATESPLAGGFIGMGYVRREHNQLGTMLGLAPGEETVRVAPLPVASGQNLPEQRTAG